jgi:hypothetical protein
MMSISDQVFVVILLVVPTLLATGAAALVFRALLSQRRAAERQELRLNAFSAIVPLRIAAHERAVLFLTRIQPDAIILRSDVSRMNAGQLRQALLEDLRAEYEHNAVQQLYISDAAWTALLFARDTVAELIADAANELPPIASGLDYAQAVLTAVKDRNEGPVPTPITEAIRRLKADLAATH